MTVVGIGNSCCDTLLEVDALPAPGGKVPIRAAMHQTGGQIAGAMIGCARLGLQARFLLRTGDDDAGVLQRQALAAAGVDISFSKIIPGVPSATATIVRDRRGERIVLWHTDPRLAVVPADITPAIVASSDALLFDGMDGPACLRAAELARARGIPVIADLDCVYDHTDALLPVIDHLIVPADFSAPPPRPGQCLVVTEGARGATAYANGQRLQVPAFPVEVRDTTGAGDAFHAGYIYALLADYPLPQRLRFASAAAALACTEVGAQTALPTLTQVERFLAQHS